MYGLIIVGIVFLFMLAAIVLAGFLMDSFYGTPLPQKAYILLIFGIGLPLFLVSFFIFSFQQRRTLTCDSTGCEIFATNFWNSSYETDSIQWNQITDTNLVDEYTDKSAKTMRFEVSVNGQEKHLLSWSIFNSKSFDNLINMVNHATPHLPYIWIKTSQADDRQTIVEVRKYSKVTRK